MSHIRKVTRCDEEIKSGGDPGGVTDGDVDVAFGLIIASWHWPDAGYLENAIEVINVLKKMVVPCKNADGDSILALTMCKSGSLH